MRILEQIGTDVKHDAARALLVDAGQKVDGRARLSGTAAS